MLKPLADALRDGDTVRAVIRGTGSSQDGKTPGITMPNGSAQEELIRTVYERAGLNPLETSYVECHGTGYVDLPSNILSCKGGSAYLSGFLVPVFVVLSYLC